MHTLPQTLFTIIFHATKQSVNIVKCVSYKTEEIARGINHQSCMVFIYMYMYTHKYIINYLTESGFIPSLKFDSLWVGLNKKMGHTHVICYLDCWIELTKHNYIYIHMYTAYGQVLQSQTIV